MIRGVLINRHGDRSVLQVVPLPPPEARTGEVLVRVQRASLNHLDLWVRTGQVGFEVPMPRVMGSDGAGVVEALGVGVTGLVVGDRVLLNPGISCGHCEFCVEGEQSLCPSYQILGEHRNGTMAELVAVPAAAVAPIPAGLSMDQAAALPLVFLTAWRLIVTKGRVRPGQDVLIQGIGGGVALAALQIAKMAGARVFVTSTSEEKIQRALQLGAYAGFLGGRPDVAMDIRKITGKRGVDVVVDTVGAATWDVTLQAVARGGRVVTCGATSGGGPPADLPRIFWKQISILGSTMGNHREFRSMLQAAGAGALTPVVDSVFPMDRIQEAHARLESRGQFGKIVVAISGM